MADDRDGLVSRWSRLKYQERHQRAKSKEPAEDLAHAPREDGEVAPAHAPDKSAIVEQLPDIETLDEGSDFTVFLKEGVPEALRRRALRRLWRLNPVFANLDGLAEYDEDFTVVSTLAANVKTIYQVGKGMVDAETPESKEDDAAVTGDQNKEAEIEPPTHAEGPVPVDPLAVTQESGPATEELRLAPDTETDYGREPIDTRPDVAHAESSAARRRWSGFSS